jgi:hypothetical protein
MKPSVGQTLYSRNTGNAARGRESILTPVNITKVGTKYFTVEGENRCPRISEHYLDNWKQKTEYSIDCVLYSDPQEWEDEKEALKLYSEIRDKIVKLRPGSKDLAALRKISIFLP